MTLMQARLLVIALVLLAGCVERAAVPEQPEPALRIASFNIQVFGDKKSNDTEVMNAIASILREYDVVAVQEIRDSEGVAMQRLMQRLPDYDFVIGPRLGTTSSKEQYAFAYRKTMSFHGNYTYNGTGFERPPLIAAFSSEGFDFVLITAHTKPDDQGDATVKEINSLADVADQARILFPAERDFIILGDLNADCSYAREKDISLDGFVWVIGPDADTTVRQSTHCAYDRILFTEEAAEDFAAAWGVNVFESNETEALRVSDHYPVWAGFYTNRDSD
ncbi:MAG: endonuclease/exonuclease/phosphatase family protein [Candidatus Diapherotrites archaeon]|nr:endonuclease/exonuclease/phosphatase family protein [Candidatus Diapherotrites archaeon]